MAPRDPMALSSLLDDETIGDFEVPSDSDSDVADPADGLEPSTQPTDSQLDPFDDTQFDDTLLDETQPDETQAENTQEDDIEDTQPSVSKLKKLVWRREYVRKFFQLGAVELERGHIMGRSNKLSNLRKAIVSILPVMKSTFPEARDLFTIENLTTKWGNTYQLYKRALQLVNKSGTGYDDESGKISVTEAVWDDWVAKNKKYKSLRSKGMPFIRSLYDGIWLNTKPTGNNIAEVGDLGRQGHDDDDDDVIPSESSSQLQTPIRPRKRRRAADWDPDKRTESPGAANNVLDRFEGSRSINKKTAAAQAKLEARTESARIWRSGLDNIATGGGEAVAKAIEVCTSEYSEKLGGDGLVRAYEYFEANPIRASGFCALPHVARLVLLEKYGILRPAIEVDEGDIRSQAEGSEESDIDSI